MVLLLRGSPQFITQLTAAGYFLPVVQWSSVRRCRRAPLQARRAHPPCRLLHPLHVVQQASRILTYPNGNYLYMAFLYERSDLIGMLQAGSGASERADLIPLLMSPAAAAAIIQLASGVNSFTGYVEVKIDGAWGSICAATSGPISWSMADAQVACRQLGLPWSGAYPFYGFYPNYVNTTGRASQGIVPFSISAVNCSGSEAKITDCVHVVGLQTNSICSGYDAGAMSFGGGESRWVGEIQTSPVHLAYCIAASARGIAYSGYYCATEEAACMHVALFSPSTYPPLLLQECPVSIPLPCLLRHRRRLPRLQPRPRDHHPQVS